MRAYLSDLIAVEALPMRRLILMIERIRWVLIAAGGFADLPGQRLDLTRERCHWAFDG